MSDLDYHNRSGYLQAQREFQETDLVDGEVVPFTNIMDRGYRVTMSSWTEGRQLTHQPPSAKSDERFRGRQTIVAGKVAKDRSANERGVKVSKRTGLVKRGFQPGMSGKRFNYAWLTWTFQSNFMYRPVL